MVYTSIKMAHRKSLDVSDDALELAAGGAQGGNMTPAGVLALADS